VQFLLQFETPGQADVEPMTPREIKPARADSERKAEATADGDEPKIVSLDTFRKK
jgi:hypothetical protein